MIVKVGGKVIGQNENGVNVGGTEAVIIKPPNITIGKEVESQEVQFFVADYTTD